MRVGRSVRQDTIACARHSKNQESSLISVENLLQILQHAAIAEDTNNPCGVRHRVEDPTPVGTKRARSPDDEHQEPPTKRQKPSEPSLDGSLTPEPEDTERHPEPEPEPARFPVWRNTFSVQSLLCLPEQQKLPETQKRTRASARKSQAAAAAVSCCERETKLRDWLVEHSRDVPTRYDLGPVVFAVKEDGSGLSANTEDEEVRHIVDLDNLEEDPTFDPDAYGLRPSNKAVGGLLGELSKAIKTHRAERAGRFYLVVPPSLASSNEDNTLQFELEVEVILSLIPDAIPPDRNAYRVRPMDIDEPMRPFVTRFFHKPGRPAAYDDRTSISFFYSILGAAPPLAKLELEESLQPPALLPTLLPFQRRSVAWLLSREGKALAADGSIVESVNDDSQLPLFWSMLDSPAGPVYANRITGELLTSRPEYTPCLGGMLAEEPGLGKTLESIALVLLNPAPPERTPEVGYWDEDARLEVKEVRTTLIVTPPSLAQQWIDEIKRHAPSLKVMMYEGWTHKPTIVNDPDAVVETEKKGKKGKKPAKAAKKGKGKGKAAAAEPVEDSQAEGSSKTGLASEGFINLDASEDELKEWCHFAHKFDVVITTYPVFQKDLNVAQAPYERPRRITASYGEYEQPERPRSPLVKCEWYRVLMDEVQMIGGGRAEEMVSLIPRRSSWAVSGTPARSRVGDLMHSLRFLRVPEVSSKQVWNRLLKPGYVNDFVTLFRKYAIRTTKSSVKNELTIPQQTRYLVPINLGSIEQHVYDQNYQEALDALGFDARGVALAEGWEVDATLLRTWLRKLRGIATHPQVGQLHVVGDKLNQPGVLKTMTEVLENMRDLNWRETMDERKKKVDTAVRYARLIQEADNRQRYQTALETLVQAEQDAKALVDDIEAAISQHDAAGEKLKQEAAALREVRGQKLPEEPSKKGKGKGKDRDREHETESEIDGSIYEGLPKTPAGEAHAAKRRGMVARLRECRLSLHRVKFLQGDVYHILGEAQSTQEDAAYKAAEELRKLLLKTTEERALKAMEELAEEDDDISEKDLMLDVPYFGKGGIRSAELLEEGNALVEDVLNKQAALMWEWRTKIRTLLTQNLLSGDETTGEEYSKSLDTQREVECYLQAYSNLLSDRRELLYNERTTLAAHQGRGKPKRKTKAARQAEEARAALQTLESMGLQAEDEALQLKLEQEREDVKLAANGRALKSIHIELGGVLTRITRDQDPEQVIVKNAINATRRLMSAQEELLGKLDADLAVYRRTFNERILYFRQLQEISDSVVDVEWEGPLAEAIQICQEEQMRADTKVKAGRARQRYLDHLAQDQASGDRDPEDNTCILCSCDFTRGFMTHCAHIFCEDCMQLWLTRKDSNQCPVCRVSINASELEPFLLGGAPEETSDPKADAVPSPPEPVPVSRRKIEYNMIDPTLLDVINSVEALGSYGSKIQTLVRHLHYVQLTDPGAKSIVFSAWADSLSILQHALKHNGIRCLRIDQANGSKTAMKKFTTDPEILVLLLHGERENAGLNVTCASRVFLLESVVNHSFEIQAIARIDRMGQTRATEVYCYYAEKTVEKNILDLAARRGLSLYTKENARGTLDVTPLANAAVKEAESLTLAKRANKPKGGQKGDFVFSVDDMLAIFFPHMFEEIEFLLPEEDLETQSPTRSQSQSQFQSQSQAGPSGSGQGNAVAGPSRLG